MPARRSRCEGSISDRRDKDGRITGYAAILDLGIVNGRRKRVKRETKTKREAQLKLAELKRMQDDGYALTADKMKVGVFLMHWLEEEVRPRLKPHSFAEYARAVERQIIPELGHHSLATLRTWDVQVAVSHWRKRGTPTVTINFALARLEQALRQAVIWQLVPRNVAEPIEPLPLTKPRDPKASGSPGRPSAKVDGGEVARLRCAGWEWARIASHFQVSVDTAQRAYKRHLMDQGREE